MLVFAFLSHIKHLIFVLQNLRECGIRMDDPRVKCMMENLNKHNINCKEVDAVDSQIFLDQATFKKYLQIINFMLK